MRGPVLLVLAVGAVVGAWLAPVDPPQPQTPQYRTVNSSVLVCPRTGAAASATNVLGAMTAGPVTGPGQAALGRLGPTADLVRLAAPDVPVALALGGPEQTSMVLRATGSWAPWSFSGILVRGATGVERGLASAACLPPRPEWWFVGAGSQIGRAAALLVTNPADEPARFDIDLFSSAGPVTAVAGKGIDLGPGASVRLRMDALAPDRDLLAIHVTATNGRVAAALRDVAVPRDGRPRGVDYIPPAQQPDTRLVMAGIPPGSGRRELILVNPGTQFATVTPRLLTEEGPIELADLATIAVPAGAVIRVDLARVLDGAGGTLDLTSDVPIAGGARVEVGAAVRDLTWLAAVPLVGDPDPLAGVGAAPSGPGLSTSVTVAAPAGQVQGTLTTVRTRSEELAPLSGRPRSGPADARGEGYQVVVPDQDVEIVTEAVTVASGSQRTIEIGATSGDPAPAGVVALTWRSEPDSAPAAVSHLVLDPDRPLLTGYPWWPVASTVLAVPVRENLGVLVTDG